MSKDLIEELRMMLREVTHVVILADSVHAETLQLIARVERLERKYEHHDNEGTWN